MLATPAPLEYGSLEEGGRHLDHESDNDESAFEIVFSRRRLAGSGVLIAALLAFFSGASYLIGKSAAIQAPPRAPQLPVLSTTQVPPAQVPTLPSQIDQVPVPQVPPPQPGPAVTKQPLFAETRTGQLYLQVGVVDKGVAATWAEGLRAHGLDAFVAPGPAEIWGKVEIGPLPDPQSYQRAKDALDELHIAAFVWQKESPAPPGVITAGLHKSP
jgi:hypothetical protein